MDSSEILEQARTGPDTPHGWVVLPLGRDKVILGILGWILGIVLGMGLFTLLAFIMIPYNYQHGAGPAIFSTILLGILLFTGLGSLWALIIDIRRLLAIEKHVIVITPEAFVKQEGEKIIHVPLMYVRHVTARGAAPPADRSIESVGLDTQSHARDNLIGFVAGRGFTPSGMRWRRKRMRTPTSLAFIDSRTDSEVTVVTDAAYGDPFMIAALLKQYAASVQHIA
ncbi:MAG: hypothetical protein ACJ788_22250 [Ktedonobacteraceae bacterium]